MSIRGAQGGYRLSRPADHISVGDVLRALEGDLNAVQCTATTSEGCQGADLCVTKYVWQKINESISRTVDEIMISQLVEESKKAQKNKENQPVDYSDKSCLG
jgi:Rrf2 family protein